VETGKHYNYFRDYDPGLGRYLQSDPMGVLPGPATFTYATGSPLSRGDFLGLMDCVYIYGNQGTDVSTSTIRQIILSNFEHFTWKNPEPEFGPDIKELGPRAHGKGLPVKPTIKVDWYAVYQDLVKSMTTTTLKPWVEIESFCTDTLDCGKTIHWHNPMTRHYGQAFKQMTTSWDTENEERFLFRADFDWFLP
jgi:hypothetical protein